jgi:hypothetical protein
VADVRLGAVAVANLDRMILTHSLPPDTRARVRRSLRALERFPRIGRELDGAWTPFRCILGPWRWMLVVYDYDSVADEVLIVTIQDARSSSAATAAQI